MRDIFRISSKTPLPAIDLLHFMTTHGLMTNVHRFQILKTRTCLTMGRNKQVNLVKDVHDKSRYRQMNLL